MGPTASGKSALAGELARRYGGRLLSVDSMKIYRGMDIGTAKPSAEVRREIVHYGIDVADPWKGCSFTVHDYVALADRAIAEIAAAGAPVIAVGGTHLYLKALIEGLFDAPGESPEVRARFKARADVEGSAALHGELTRYDPAAAARIHPNDRRRIIRALEVYELTGTPISELQTQWDAGRVRYDWRGVRLVRDRADGNGRINRRVERMMAAGLAAEVRRLAADERGLNDQAAAAVGYAEILAAGRGECTLEEAVERIKINTRRFAKNQRTWLRRFTDAHRLELAADTDTRQAADRAAGLLGLEEGGR